MSLSLRSAAAIALFAIATSAGADAAPGDPLAEEIRLWTERVKSSALTHAMWTDAKGFAGPALVQAEKALVAGRRWFALQRFVRAREILAAGHYVAGLAETDRTPAGFEAAWTRAGVTLSGSNRLDPKAFADLQPAAVRAVTEAARLQARVYYDASLEYGRNTMPDSGLYYLGSALAQHELVSLSRRLSQPEKRRAPPVRSLRTEIDALQTELLTAYRPPASLDRHPEFINANATLKEARELDEAGLRYGALLRYLQAAQRTAPLRGPAVPPRSRIEVARDLAALRARITEGAVDHTVAEALLEQAEAELDGLTAEAPASALAVVMAQDVLPRYFDALSPEKPRPVAPPPGATVTLVRWPYT
jgi:hypothetical protein